MILGRNTQVKAIYYFLKYYCNYIWNFLCDTNCKHFKVTKKWIGYLTKCLQELVSIWRKIRMPLYLIFKTRNEFHRQND